MQKPHHVKQSPQESRQGCTVRAAASTGSPRAPRTLLLRAYRNTPRLPSPLLCAYVQTKAKWKFEQRTGIRTSSKRYLSPSIFQPLHEKDGDLVAQSTPGGGSRSLAAAAPASQSPQPFHGTTSPTRYSALLPRAQRGTRLPSASTATASSACRRLWRRGVLSLAVARCSTWGHATSHPQTLSRRHVPITQPDGSPVF